MGGSKARLKYSVTLAPPKENQPRNNGEIVLLILLLYFTYTIFKAPSPIFKWIYSSYFLNSHFTEDQDLF